MHAIFFPGQGAQFKGMGRDLFKRYPLLTSTASDILGYAIDTLCLDDPDQNLNQTQFTQPALYVVNALAYYAWLESDTATRPDYVAGHSLGEYNALLAADVFSFEEGLQLVKLRGQLMAEANGGGMAAVMGIPAAQVEAALQEAGLANVELVNFNSPTQTVISGTAADIAAAERMFSARAIRCVILKVSAAFHSRYMRPAQDIFLRTLQGHALRTPKIPVIANLNARPYEMGRMHETLGMQIASPVKWVDSVIYMLAQGDLSYAEIGSNILTKLSNEIQRVCGPEIERMKQSQRSIQTQKSVAVAKEKYFQPW